jgi:hypothetical protein
MFAFRPGGLDRRAEELGKITAGASANAVPQAKKRTTENNPCGPHPFYIRIFLV